MQWLMWLMWWIVTIINYVVVNHHVANMMFNVVVYIVAKKWFVCIDP